MHNKCIEKGSPEVNDLKDCPSIVLCLCRVAMDSMIAMNPMATMSPTVAMNPRLQERKDSRIQWNSCRCCRYSWMPLTTFMSWSPRPIV